MLRIAHLRRGARKPALRVDQLLGIERAAAVVALVAASLLVPAVRTRTLDVAVGEESPGLRVVELLRRLFVDVSLFEQSQKEVMDDLLVVGCAGRREQVERDAELAPVAQELRVKLLDDLLRGARLVLGADGNGRAVLVAAGDHQHVVPGHTVVTREDVGREVRACDMAEVQRAVRVGPRDSDEDAAR